MSAEIWVVGGGKGGTGKSFLTASLGLHLAQSGKRVVLIDADLGGANLHSFLCEQRPQRSLTEFFEKSVPLADLLSETEVGGLQFIPGNLHTFRASAIKFVQKAKLFRHIRQLTADYVIIDLGAGSDINTLDCFLLGERMVVLIVPEVTAVDNMYLFLKKALFRKMHLLLGERGWKESVYQALQERQLTNFANIGNFLTALRDLSSELGELVDRCVGEFCVCIIVNQIRSALHVEIGSAVRSVLNKHFGIPALFSGFIEYDQFFWRYLYDGHYFWRLIPSKPVFAEIGVLAENLCAKKEVNLSRVTNVYRRI